MPKLPQHCTICAVHHEYPEEGESYTIMDSDYWVIGEAVLCQMCAGILKEILPSPGTHVWNDKE